MLTAAVKGRGTAGVAVIERAGAEPRTYWVPESDQEPAFLAYSITKTFTAVLILKLTEGRCVHSVRLSPLPRQSLPG